MKTNLMGKRCAKALALSLVLCLTGCSGGGVKLPTVPASGVVTSKGQPLADAEVAFISTSLDGKTASGKTDAEGRFQLHTYLGGTQQAAGAMPGDYQVTVQKFAADAGGSATTDPAQAGVSADQAAQARAIEEAMKRGSSEGTPGAAQLATPQIYANPKTSGFTATVKPSGENEFKFDLTE